MLLIINYYLVVITSNNFLLITRNLNLLLTVLFIFEVQDFSFLIDFWLKKSNESIDMQTNTYLYTCIYIN